MILIKDLLTEQKHSYGCVMLFFDFPEVKQIQKVITNQELYIEEDDDSYGLETEPHVTLLYGLHENVPTESVKNILKNKIFGECIIRNLSRFKQDEYDVLKFEVQGDILHQVNKELKELPHTSNFPDYKPHLTVAYLKKGNVDRLIEKFKDREYKLYPKFAVYSKPDGEQIKIQIKINEKNRRL